MRDDTIAAYLDRLAARVPAPGGGAAAALHAAQAAALLAMVARYSDGERYDAELMNRIVAEADELRADSLALAEVAAAAVAIRAAAAAARLMIEVNLKQITDQVLLDEFAATAAVTDTIAARA